MQPFWKEIRPTLALAVPMIIGQLGQMLMPLIDAAMVGRLGVTPLAAVAFGNLVVWIPMIAGFGICVSVHVLVASAHSANDHEEAGEVLRHGLGMSAAYGIACSLVLQLSLNLLDFIPRVAPDVIAASKPFIALVGWSIVPVLTYTTVKNYCEARNRPWLPLVVLCGSVALNVLLNWVFIYGHCGFSPMGVSGAGLATLISRSAAFFVLLLIVQRSPSLRARWPRGVLARPTFERLARMLALGGPSAGQILFEVGVFNLVTLLAGMMSKVVLDAHQIALNIAAVAFMVPLGLSQATGIRVSQAMGLKQYAQARRIGWNSLACSSVFMALYAGFILLTRQALPHLFLRADAPGAESVLALSSKLLLWAAGFAVFDGAQIVSLGILRAVHDVRVPTVISFTGYWLIAAPLAWYFGMRQGLGGPGLWGGVSVGVFTVAVLLVGRFAAVSRRFERRESLAKTTGEGIVIKE